MTPAARVQAAIEVLDLVIAAARNQGAPADRIVSEWFRPRRFAGSGDRRAVRELVYAAIRACGEVPQSGRAAILRLTATDPALAALFDGSKPRSNRKGAWPLRYASRDQSSIRAWTLVSTAWMRSAASVKVATSSRRLLPRASLAAST